MQHNGSDNLVQRFEYADGRLPVAMTMSGSRYYLTYDQVGSLRVVADSAFKLKKWMTYPAPTWRPTTRSKIQIINGYDQKGRN